LERGFKAEANKLSLDVRAELGLSRYAPLCPWALAESLHIPVSTLASLAEAEPEAKVASEYLAGHGRSAFSAITVFYGRRRCIVHNDGHAPQRQRSNLAHELAHALLGHPPHLPFCDSGNRIYQSKLENEASWLGPVLLVPNEAARWAMAAMSLTQSAAHFGVSEDLMQFRLRMSGAQNINRRVRARSGG
jgi:Zn-dependent peptidase ImmA (M78 family)